MTFTICSMCFNNVDYLLYQERIMRKLAYYDYNRIVINCNTEEDENEKLKQLQNVIIIDAQWINKFSGSTAHGKSIDLMTANIQSDYAIICDLDVVPLQKNWDKSIFDLIQSGYDAVGVPYNPLHKGRRIQSIPTVFFLAFRTDKFKNANLYWGTLPTKIRKLIYKSYRKLYALPHKGVKTPKIFDFEMGQLALIQMNLKGIKTKAFNMIQPWERKAELKFDISKLPDDLSMVDPLVHSYPEEWHFKGKPFVTHQRRSYARSFGISEYSKNWIKIINEYVKIND